jgi:hypothetical protein
MATKRGSKRNEDDIPKSVRGVELLSGPVHAARLRQVRAPSPSASLRRHDSSGSISDGEENHENGHTNQSDGELSDGEHDSTIRRPKAAAVTRTSSNGTTGRRPVVGVTSTTASSLMPPPAARPRGSSQARVQRSPSHHSIHSDEPDQFSQYMAQKVPRARLTPIQLHEIQQQLRDNGVTSSTDERFGRVMVQYITADDWSHSQQEQCVIPPPPRRPRSCLSQVLRFFILVAFVISILVFLGKWPRHWNPDRIIQRLTGKSIGGSCSYVGDPITALETAFDNQRRHSSLTFSVDPIIH